MFGDSCLEHMNRLATDVLDCPECSSESLEVIDVEHDEECSIETFHMSCDDCGKQFTFSR